MSAIVQALLAELDDQALDQLAHALAPRLATVLSAPSASPWLDVSGAAGYLCCSKQRIYDLVHDGALKPRRDGRRLLFLRDALDAYLTREKAA